MITSCGESGSLSSKKRAYSEIKSDDTQCNNFNIEKNSKKPHKTNKKSMLSKRALEVQNEEFFLSTGMAIVRSNKYHPENNPNGIINLGTAENRLNNAELTKKLNEASTILPEHLIYGPYHGSDKLREEVANLLNRHFNPKVLLNKENICIGNGCGALLNTYGNVLFDHGDAVLTPGPFYGGFDSDMKYGAGVHSIAVPHTEDDCLKVTEEALELAYKTAKRPVKGIVIANPNNPFGRCYSAEQLLLFCNFAKSHGLIVLCDEIYGLSTWKDIVTDNIEEGKTIEDYECHCDNCKNYKNGKTEETKNKLDGISNKFTPIYSLDLPDPENTHTLWGFSKDFCLNGLRIGVAISYSKTVMAAIQKISLFTCIPTVIDTSLTHMLSDHEWTDKYIINNNRKLYKSYKHLTLSLTAHNIPFIKGDSGFFIYIDLHQAGLDEYDLWMKLLEGGLYISPSQAFFSENTKEERNWFRICYAVTPSELDLSLNRLYKVLNDIKKN